MTWTAQKVDDWNVPVIDDPTIPVAAERNPGVMRSRDVLDAQWEALTSFLYRAFTPAQVLEDADLLADFRNRAFLGRNADIKGMMMRPEEFDFDLHGFRSLKHGEPTGIFLSVCELADPYTEVHEGGAGLIASVVSEGQRTVTDWTTVDEDGKPLTTEVPTEKDDWEAVGWFTPNDLRLDGSDSDAENLIRNMKGTMYERRSFYPMEGREYTEPELDEAKAQRIRERLGRG